MMNSMRTTLELEDDALERAKELASAEGKTVGQTVSELLRLALSLRKAEPKVRNHVPLFTPVPGARRPDLALVNELRDQE
jgi:hypothetical protein